MVGTPNMIETRSRSMTSSAVAISNRGSTVMVLA